MERVLLWVIVSMMFVVFLRVFPWKWARGVIGPSWVSVSGAFLVKDISINSRAQMVSGETPSDLFAPNAYGADMQMDNCPPGRDITVTVRSVCTEPQRCNIAFFGCDREGRRSLVLGLDSGAPIKPGETVTLRGTPQTDFLPNRLVMSPVRCRVRFLDRLLMRQPTFISYGGGPSRPGRVVDDYDDEDEDEGTPPPEVE